MSIEQITQELTDKGVALESELVRDDFDGREGSTSWSVTITRNGQSYQTEYTQGSAHRHHKGGRPIGFPCGRLSVDTIMKNKRTRPNIPILSDVMWSLVCDAQAVMFGQTFEEFTADMGYNEDSREAERIYNGCRDEYFALVRLFGNEALDELSTLFQDY